MAGNRYLEPTRGCTGNTLDIEDNSHVITTNWFLRKLVLAHEQFLFEELEETVPASTVCALDFIPTFSSDTFPALLKCQKLFQLFCSGGRITDKVLTFREITLCNEQGNQSINNVVLDSEKHSKEDRGHRRVTGGGRATWHLGRGRSGSPDPRGESSGLWGRQGSGWARKEEQLWEL